MSILENKFLLKKPVRQASRFSRKFSEILEIKLDQNPFPSQFLNKNE